MDFHLVDERQDAGPRRELVQQRHGEVGDADAAHQPGRDQILHGGPGVVHADVVDQVLAVAAVVDRLVRPPAITVGRERHVPHRGRPVYQVQIEIVRAQVREGLAEGRLHVFRPHVDPRQLRHQKQVLAGERFRLAAATAVVRHPAVDLVPQGVADRVLVEIHGGAVDAPVVSRTEDGGSQRGGNAFPDDQEGAEAEGRHRRVSAGGRVGGGGGEGGGRTGSEAAVRGCGAGHGDEDTATGRGR
mmetsp:Transcript_9107/g.20127  ORF Transcript_9107/g.20127 Transcript_9107/m.20127 type:complete len:244 (-) Transcript_9107:9-740(-)